MTWAGVVFAKDGMVDDGCCHDQQLTTETQRTQNAYYKRPSLNPALRTVSKQSRVVPLIFLSICLGNTVCQSECEDQGQISRCNLRRIEDETFARLDTCMDLARSYGNARLSKWTNAHKQIGER